MVMAITLEKFGACIERSVDRTKIYLEHLFITAALGTNDKKGSESYIPELLQLYTQPH
jgi:hypothetical protein